MNNEFTSDSNVTSRENLKNIIIMVDEANAIKVKYEKIRTLVE